MLQPIRDTFNPADFPQLLVGLAAADDAAVYQLNERQAIVTTTDFFPPVVDDPYDFGAIAAANALSDIYAMGAEVLYAVNLVAFPDTLDPDILRRILQGGADVVAAAGGVIAGGHSVIDKEPKYGLAVTGIIDPQLVKTKGGARPGDVLVLTKPLGVGVITTALKDGLAAADHVATATASMKQLNRAAARAALAAGAHAMTDITGFGLLGHGHEMADAGAVTFALQLASLPWLPGALGYGQRGIFPGGKGRNHSHFAPVVEFGAAVDTLYQDMLWTPETSGGLLIALDPAQLPLFQSAFTAAGFGPAAVVGTVEPATGPVRIKVS